MKKKLLVIGAGFAQKNAILRAKALDYSVFAVDRDPQAAGLKIADETKIISVQNINRILTWAKELNIDGVISYSTDVSLPAVCKL